MREAGDTPAGTPAREDLEAGSGSATAVLRTVVGSTLRPLGGWMSAAGAVELMAALGIPAYHHRPSAPTNLTLHQAIEINVPIGCGDAPVFPGDVILGDSDGVIVIPAHLADEIANETFEMTAFEDFVTEEVGNGRGIFGLYPATDPQTLTDFAEWRKKNGR